jgi:large subunit ribosomal protein L24
MHIRKDDIVVVLTGDDAGARHRVLRVVRTTSKVVVEGVNRVYKHLRPSRRNPQGGRLSKEMPVDASNVLLFCPTCNRGVRVGKRFETDGRKVRFCKRCNAVLGAPLRKPRKAEAR